MTHSSPATKILLISFLCTALAVSPANAQATPRVTIGYSSLLDDACVFQSGRPLDSARVNGVIAAVPTYERAWATQGPTLLQAAQQVAGAPFRFSETTAALNTCGIPNMSFPLILNSRTFSATGAPPTPDGVAIFVNTLFHEVLHRYIVDALRSRPTSSPMMARYASEMPVVQNHLHLFALQEVVYRKLGKPEELVRADSVDRLLRNSVPFARAREIVAKEGAEAFVRELHP